MLFYRFYCFILFFLQPIILLHMLIRLARGKEKKEYLRQRFGFASIKRPYGELFWFHGASVGETGSVITLIEKIHKINPKAKFLVTSWTVSSAALLKRTLPSYVMYQCVPYDLPGAMRRFLRHWRPAICFRIDSEIWPVALTEIRQMGIKHYLLNARISDRSFKKYRAKPNLSSFLFSSFDAAFAKDDDDAAKLRALGMGQVYSYGNLKFSNAVPPYHSKDLDALLKQIRNRPVWVAASTREGEEKIVFDVHHKLKKNIKNILTVLLPRHPRRRREISELATKKKIKLATRSAGQPIESTTDVYLADTMGEMGLFYRLVKVVFLGRTLSPFGGSNPIEPAQLKCATIIGTSIYNFKDLLTDMKQEGAIIQVKNGTQLAGMVETLLKDPLIATSLANKAFSYAEKQKKVVDKIIRKLRQEQLI